MSSHLDHSQLTTGSQNGVSIILVPGQMGCTQHATALKTDDAAKKRRELSDSWGLR